MNKSTQEQFATGAVRAQKLGDKVRYDLLLSNDVAMRRLAETYAEGFAKYGADNWKKGFPVSELWAHAFLHLVKWIAGDKTEDHLAHAVWNFMAIMWQEENKPELQDFPPIDPSNLDAIRKQEEFATLQLFCPITTVSSIAGSTRWEQIKAGIIDKCCNCGRSIAEHVKPGDKIPLPRTREG